MSKPLPFSPETCRDLLRPGDLPPFDRATLSTKLDALTPPIIPEVYQLRVRRDLSERRSLREPLPERRAFAGQGTLLLLLVSAFLVFGAVYAGNNESLLVRLWGGLK